MDLGERQLNEAPAFTVYRYFQQPSLPSWWECGDGRLCTGFSNSDASFTLQSVDGFSPFYFRPCRLDRAQYPCVTRYSHHAALSNARHVF